jgi:hypothetical protein
MFKKILALSALSLTACGTNQQPSHLNAGIGIPKNEQHFICTLSKDRISKSFRPKQFPTSLKVTVVTTTVKKETMGKVELIVADKGGKPARSKLEGISGDEGYTEFTVDKSVEGKYGFGYVYIHYEEPETDEEGNVLSKAPSPVLEYATLVNGGNFADCLPVKK